MFSLIYNVLKIAILLLLPFCLLIRGAVFLHYEKGLNSYISLTVSAAATAILLVIYFSVVYGRLTKRRSKIKYLRRRFAISFFLVGVFVLYGLVYLSNANTKTTEISKEFYSLQPILRLGASTLFLFDKNAIITDASRMPEDYKRMGIKINGRSLHYAQQDGYAYALDLRTKGRTEIRNNILRIYFFLMGFETIRHVGTADHLHVSMPCRYR